MYETPNFTLSPMRKYADKAWSLGPTNLLSIYLLFVNSECILLVFICVIRVCADCDGTFYSHYLR